MSFLDIDERLFELLELIEFDRSPLTDIKEVGDCDIGIIEGGLCNAENVHVLREFRAHCKKLIAVGACAINGGLPAQRNHLEPAADPAGGLPAPSLGLANGLIPNDPELPLPLNKVHPLHEVVQDRLLHARLPAVGRRDLEGADRHPRRPRARISATA